MLAEDTEIWSGYLADPIAAIKEVWYDLHVGGIVRGITEGDILAEKIARGITRKRIDVVAAVGGGYWVIEIKPFASMLALGQVLTYRRLFVEEYRLSGEVFPVVISRQADEDMVADFQAVGVLVIVI